MTTGPRGAVAAPGGVTRVLASVIVGALVSLALPFGALETSAKDSGTKTRKPDTDTVAWYWEEQRSREFQDEDGNIVRVEAPNPYCPGAPGSVGSVEPTCAEGRLPVEIQNGDYETPNKLSAVSFDLTTIPVGSTIEKFEVTFLEAEARCYDHDDDPSTARQCESTDPVNVQGHKLQACLVTEIFGEGYARPYEEMPRFRCTDDDPVAERAKIKDEDKTQEDEGQDRDADHAWTFDLTEYAIEWKADFAVATAILVQGATPKRTEEQGGPADTWSVVLFGPKKDGIVTKIVYEPPPAPETPTDTSDVPPVAPPTSTSTDTGFGTGSTDLGTDTTETGSTDTRPATRDGEAPVEAEEEPASAAGEAPDVETIPGYMWLAILAGIVAFSLVRSVVVESVSGARPDGVLAQIHKINSERRGVAVAVQDRPGPGARIADALGTIGAGAGSLVRRIRVPKLFSRG